MAIHYLKNNFLTLQVNDFGAELASIYDQHAETEYLWNGNPDYWKRRSPILFPFVGLLKNKSYQFQGQTYSSLQHGFARDMNFTVMSSTDEEIWFQLEATEATRKIYPFDFRLKLGYLLQGRKITVFWKVINQGMEKMYFSIGGHPGFRCPLDPTEDQEHCFLKFDTLEPIRYLHINENGLLVKKVTGVQNVLTTDLGLLPVDVRMFDYDALIIEDNQCHKVSLLDTSMLPYLTITFDAPLFGIWSPAKMNAPFVCIEPWYGRCDASDFNGNLEEREYGNSLESGGIFEAKYTIEIH